MTEDPCHCVLFVYTQPNLQMLLTIFKWVTKPASRIKLQLWIGMSNSRHVCVHELQYEEAAAPRQHSCEAGVKTRGALRVLFSAAATRSLVPGTLHLLRCSTARHLNQTVMLARLALLPLALAAGHTIANMPYHRQITEYACGDASMEMVLHRWASPDVDQRAIIDLMRTTWANGVSPRCRQCPSFAVCDLCPLGCAGTLSYDLVRAGHFSHMSASPVCVRAFRVPVPQCMTPLPPSLPPTRREDYTLPRRPQRGGPPIVPWAWGPFIVAAANAGCRICAPHWMLTFPSSCCSTMGLNHPGRCVCVCVGGVRMGGMQQATLCLFEFISVCGSMAERHPLPCGDWL